MVRSSAMGAAHALADLTEISSQIEAAVLAGKDGTVVASTFGDDEQAASVAAAALELLEAARQAQPDGAEPPVQIQAVTPEGSLFVVQDGQHLIAAVTGDEPTVGLVFYDLKTCLRLAGDEEEEKPKAPRRRRKKEEAPDAQA